MRNMVAESKLQEVQVPFVTAHGGSFWFLPAQCVTACRSLSKWLCFAAEKQVSANSARAMDYLCLPEQTVWH